MTDCVIIHLKRKEVVKHIKLEWSKERRTWISNLISSTLIQSEGQKLGECNLSKDGAVCK